MNVPTVNLLLVSDLHLDSGRYDLASHITRHEDAGERIDTVILAGDLMEVAGGCPVKWASHEVPSHIPAIIVPGNHDFYGGFYGNVINRMKANALGGSHVHVLVEDSLTVRAPAGAGGGELVLLGTPLWSNLQGLGPLVEAHLKQNVHKYVSDFSLIRGSDGRRWDVGQMLALFDRAERFLTRELSPAALADGRRRVVVTHFGPHRGSIAPKWRNDELTAYFINHLPELVERADLWLHGHTHTACDYQVGDDPARGRVICHPRGYSQGHEREQAKAYRPRYIQVPVERVPWELPDPLAV